MADSKLLVGRGRWLRLVSECLSNYRVIVLNPTGLQLEHGICQCVGDSKIRQGGANSTDDHPLGCVSRNNKTPMRALSPVTTTSRVEMLSSLLAVATRMSRIDAAVNDTRMTKPALIKVRGGTKLGLPALMAGLAVGQPMSKVGPPCPQWTDHGVCVGLSPGPVRNPPPPSSAEIVTIRMIVARVTEMLLPETSGSYCEAQGCAVVARFPVFPATCCC